MSLKHVSLVAMLLVVIGAVNWGLIAFGDLFLDGTNLNVVELVLGAWPALVQFTYLIIGAAGLVVGYDAYKSMPKK